MVKPNYWLVDLFSDDVFEYTSIEEVKEFLLNMWQDDIYVSHEDVDWANEGDCPVSIHMDNIRNTTDEDKINSYLGGVGYLMFSDEQEYKDNALSHSKGGNLDV